MMTQMNFESISISIEEARLQFQLNQLVFFEEEEEEMKQRVSIAFDAPLIIEHFFRTRHIIL